MQIRFKDQRACRDFLINYFVNALKNAHPSINSSNIMTDEAFSSMFKVQLRDFIAADIRKDITDAANQLLREIKP